MAATATKELTVAKNREDWRPERLRELRESHGLTLEQAGDLLRSVAEQASLRPPAANVQTLWQHEQGETFPGPDYRRVYCLMYRATEPELGFRRALPGEESRLPLTPVDVQQNGASVMAVERALLQIVPTGGEIGHLQVHQRMMDAFRRRHTGGDPHQPTLVLVGGFAGSGKTEFAKFLSQLSGWPLLDKDPLTRPLVERLLISMGGSANDRHTKLYLEQVRPLEYDCLMQAVYANLKCQISTVVTAPFIAEMSHQDWMRRLTNRCRALGVDVAPIWILCDEETMHEYIKDRSAARDAWKIENWDEYISSVKLDLRPAVPYLTVDNRLGAAVSLADQARYAMAVVQP